MEGGGWDCDILAEVWIMKIPTHHMSIDHSTQSMGMNGCFTLLPIIMLRVALNEQFINLHTHQLSLLDFTHPTDIDVCLLIPWKLASSLISPVFHQ